MELLVKEIGSFLGWLIIVTTSVVAIFLIAEIAGASSDIALLLSCFPIIATLAVGVHEDQGTAVAAVLRYTGWFYGAFCAVLVTAFLLSAMV
ncbi:MAG: hypothetical protein ACR2QW_16975 [bacterium]